MRSILLLLVLTGVAQAKPGGGEVITDKDLVPYWQELGEQLKLVKDRKRSADEVLVTFRTLAAREKEPRTRAIRFYVHGVMLMQILKRPKDAKKEFDKALKGFPRFPAVLGRLATLAHEAGDTRRAIRLLDQALGHDPMYTKALNYKGKILALQAKFDEAIKLFKESFDVDSNVVACVQLATIYVHKYKTAYVAKRKKLHADETVMWADNYMALAPSDGNAYRIGAQVRAEVGRYKDAVEILEQAQVADISTNAKAATLNQLYMLHARHNRLKAAVDALKRLLKFKGEIDAKARAAIEQKIKDLEDNGGRAFLIWYIEAQVKILENPGHDARSRADAMRELLRFLTDAKVIKMKEFAARRLDVFRVCVRSLSKSPPEVTLLMFEFFQSFQKDAKLLPILVAFVYPADDDNRTPEVRTEAVQTIATLGGIAVLPTLYYCLKDEPGLVLREVERQLAAICGVRSKVGEGMEPLTRGQKKLARRAWRDYFRGEQGSQKLIEALAELRKHVSMDGGFNRSLETKPMADHIASTIVMDGDMPFPTWLAGYEFLRDYLLKEFRGVNERGKKVTRADQKPITNAVKKFFGGANATMPEVTETGGTKEDK